MSETRTAVVLMAYGTPRSPADILPYYTDIRRGRPPTDEQLADLTARYEAIGGISPLAQRTEAQRGALQAALDRAAPGGYHVVLGLKHAAPFIEQAVDDLAAAGLPAASSAWCWRRTSRRSRSASTSTGWRPPPSRTASPSAGSTAGRRNRPSSSSSPTTCAPGWPRCRGATRVLFTAHSLPERIIAAGDPYPAQLQATAEAVAAAVGLDNWGLAWQSAGRTPEPWIGPDILQVIDELAADGATQGVLVSAVGFVADHLEVLYDLDIEAAGRAARAGPRASPARRASTTTPR